MDKTRDRDVAAQEPQALIAPQFSEEALALLFAELYADELRYVAGWGKWLRFDGTKWGFDETREVFSLAREVCREVAATANKPSEAKIIASAKTRAAVTSLTSDDRRIAATVDQWDQDLWLLNTPNGVVDLRTGEMREHRADDYMTKLTAAAPDKSCRTALWSQFLARVTANDKDLENFLARMVGYALTGSIDEHALFFLYGSGANGKGVFMRTTTGILGDYHRTAPIETFTASDVDRHPTELAMLRGARMVSVSETEEGRRWAEKRISQLTGGDPIPARFMRQDFFEFIPQFKLIISGNHKPSLRSVNEAIRRRFNLLPFAVTIPEEERDIELTEKLKAEWPGILAWMIEGCLEWQEIGLAPPRCVTEATENYLAGEDATQMFLDDCCTLGREKWTASDDLFKEWRNWAEAHGEFVGSTKRFGQSLETKGLMPRKFEGKRGYQGVAIAWAEAAARQKAEAAAREPPISKSFGTHRTRVR
jgi:putative DNA primase/helicase